MSVFCLLVLSVNEKAENSQAMLMDLSFFLLAFVLPDIFWGHSIRYVKFRTVLFPY